MTACITDKQVEQIHAFLRQGLKQREVAALVGVSQGSVLRYKPKDHIGRRPGRPRGCSFRELYNKRIPREFPVHPEVVAAREHLLAIFSAKVFDTDAFANAQRRLNSLLLQHHPIEGRPSEQRASEVRSYYQEAAE